MRFSGSRVQISRTDNNFVFYLSTCKRKMDKTTCRNVKQIHLCHSFTMDRQYLGYHLMYYPPSYLQHFLLQISIFVYNFYSGVNFCGKKIAVILFCENLFLQIAKKPTKIRARKHLVPHSTLINVLFACIIQSKLYSLDGL